MLSRSQVIGSPLRADIVAAFAIAAFVGLLGLWPHIKFVSEIGELRYFQGAYDEDSYTLSWLLGTLRSTRALSGFALSAVYAACNFSLDATLIVSDFVFPFLATCAAYFAACQILRGRAARILTALLLVFANDLFSLGNLAIWSNGRFNIFAFTQVVSVLGANLVPPYETSFLAIFRTPEPQASFTLMFLILGLLARLARNAEAAGLAGYVVLMVTVSLLPLGYTFIAAPVAALVAGAAILFALFRLERAALSAAAGLLGAVLVLLVAHYWQRSGGQSTESLATGLSYHSRLPVVTPAAITSLAVGCWFGAWLLRQEQRRQPLAWLTAGCVLLPLVLTNQQLISGVMISARDWERNVSYPLLVFGMASALSLVFSSLRVKEDHFAAVAWAISVLCVLLVCRGQFAAFRLWETRNIESVAIVRGLSAIDPTLATNSRLTFGDAGISQFIQVRMKDSINVPLTFYKVAMRFIPNMAQDAKTADPSPYENLVFEYWLRVGVSPNQADGLLKTEIKQRAGTFTNYLFSFRDGWYPASDNRALRQAELERSVPEIVARYRRYILPQNRREVVDQRGLLISEKSPEQLSPSLWLRNEYIGSGQAGRVRAYVYLQHPQ